MYVVDADLKSYFDTIPKPRLMARVAEKVSDQRVLRLVEKFLEQGVMDGLREWTPETGTPQGAVLPPLLANIYLNPLDHLLDDAGFALVRYADDFVILCRTREDAERALALVQSWVVENELALHPTKTKIVDARTEGFDFLGYHFRGELRLPREKSLQKFKDAVRLKTKRTNGRDLFCICARLSSQCADGLRTSVIVTGEYSATWTAGYAGACAASCASVRNGVAGRVEPTTSVGRMPTSTSMGCTA